MKLKFDYFLNAYNYYNLKYRKETNSLIVFNLIIVNVLSHKRKIQCGVSILQVVYVYMNKMLYQNF